MTHSVAHRGSFALVSYVPEPLCSVLYQMRLALPGSYHPLPHVTLLPPRPLLGSADQVGHEVASLFRAQEPFEIELLNVRSFPETNVLYLDIGEGSDRLRYIHSRLNTDHMAHKEVFTYSPHLTIGGPCEPAALRPTLARAEAMWNANGSRRCFTLNEIVLLWLAKGGLSHDWKPLWTYRMGEAAVRKEEDTNAAKAAGRKSLAVAAPGSPQP
jgi:2'-5' RNA ligase